VPIPVPTGTTADYSGLYGFGAVGHKRNVTAKPILVDSTDKFFTAVTTAGNWVKLMQPLTLPHGSRVAAGVYLDLGGFSLRANDGFCLELGEYGRPNTAVSDVSIVNGFFGPQDGGGGDQSGDGVRIHAGSTRIWLDRLDFTGPFGDEAFSMLHYIDEPKSPMAVSITRTKFHDMNHSAGVKNYAVLCGTGEDNYEDGPWTSTSQRLSPNQITLYRVVLDDVWWRIPLVYHSRLHMKECTVRKWNDGGNGGSAVCLYGASDAIIEDCTFDKGTSSSDAFAIEADWAHGFLPRVTERRNTFLGNMPAGTVNLRGAPLTLMVLPYSNTVRE